MRLLNKLNFQNDSGKVSKLRNEIILILRNGLARISDLLTFKNECKQLLAMWMICALLLPFFAAPVSIAAAKSGKKDAVEEDYSQFEPVNGEQSVLKSVTTELNLGVERLLTSSLKINNFSAATKGKNTDSSDTDSNEKPVENKETVEAESGSKRIIAADDNEDSKQVKLSGSVDTGEKKSTKESSQSSTVSKASAAQSNTSLLTIDPADRPILNETQLSKLVSSRNNLGNPLGQTEAPSLIGAAAAHTRERAGIGNFNFGLPVTSLPGRGINASVGISYNSQLWTKSTDPNTSSDQFTYNVDGNWLAPGFHIGYGYLDLYTNGNVTTSTFILTEANGTRRQLTRVSGDAVYTKCIFESNDGSFTRLEFMGNYYDMKLTYSDGTTVYFSQPNSQNRRFPTKIVDVQGNYLTIEYLADQEVGKISKIVDTLGREILFHYDSTDHKLLAVSVPGFNNSAQVQVMRFYYETFALQSASRFSGTIVAPANVTVLKYIYMPGTGSGYKYDYSSYYGMIYKVTKLEGMQVTTTSSTQMGSVLQTYTEAASTRYNYAGTDIEPPAPSLSDFPKYDKRTDDWIGRSGSTAPQTIFSFTEDATTRTTQITNPDSTTTVSISEKTGDWKDGLIKETYTTGPGRTNPWSRTIYTWQEGSITYGRKNPRIQKIETINEAGQAKAQTFEYDSYNNQTVIRDHDYAPTGQTGTELRKTLIDYQTGGTNNQWLAKNLLNLPTSVKTVVNNQTVSRTDYEYDNYQSQQLANTPGVIKHEATHDPYTSETRTVRGACKTVYQPPYGSPVCTEYYINTVNAYDSATNYRGNITKVTSFADATNANDPDKSVKNIKYDITGNIIEVPLSCCNVKTIEYSATNQYAYPTKETKGSSIQLVTKTDYDPSTGLVTKTTDENNQETNYEYETDTFRQKKVIYSNGKYVQAEYSDKLSAGSVPSFIRTTATLEANKTVQNYKYFDGLGLGIRNATDTVNGWNVSAVEYDNLGRAVKTYNPFYVAAPNATIPANTAFSKVVNYDGLGRVPQAQLQDGTTINNYFNEAAVTFTAPDNSSVTGTASRMTDQAGKERRQVVDSFGRIVRVDEPNSSGTLGTVNSPTQPTYYFYDGNGNLSKTIQTDGTVTQERRFKYDSLSRLTHERQIEANPTLDINGLKGAVDPNKWTKVLKYNPDSLITEGTDARGVKSTFSYDSLNRIQSTTFSDGTPTVTYTYDQARTGFFNKGALTRVETADGGMARPDTPATATEYDYDKMGRAVKHRQSIGSQAYTIEYEYNLGGQLISEKYPSGRTVAINYDTKGGLSTVADATRTYLSGLQFQGKGGSLSSMTYGNGTTQNFALNDRLQMISQELKRGTEVLQKYDYAYGQIDTSTGTIAANSNNGQLAKIESTVGANKQFEQRFAYDMIGRLKEAREHRGDNNVLSYKQVFDYDNFGNLYRKNASNPTLGQATPISFAPIESGDIDKTNNHLTTGTQYDDAGNVVQDTRFRYQNFLYDANGRMYKNSSTVISNQSNAVYDAAGMRVATQVDGVWTFSVYNIGGKKVAEYGGLPAADEGGVKYILQDHQGSSRAIVNNAGYVNARMDYTAFGEDIQSNIGQRTAQGYSSSTTLNQKYALTERDKATGLDHTWFRKHENRAGRWTSPDPYKGSINIGDPQTFNRYSYTNSQPTNFVDPTGLQISYYCQWWTWVYTDGPDKGQEVPGSTRWLVCYTVDDGRGGGGRHDVEIPGGGNTNSSPDNDADQTKWKGFQDCINNQATGVPFNLRNYTSAANDIRRRTDAAIEYASAIYVAAGVFSFLTGNLPMLLVATIAYISASDAALYYEESSLTAQREILHNNINKTIADCATKNGISQTDVRKRGNSK